MGVGSNSAYLMTYDGLLGVRVLSTPSILLCALVPLPVLVALGLVFQPSSPAVYAAVWLASLLLLYDELKARRLKKLRGLSIDEFAARRGSWRISWRTVRKAGWDGSTLTTSTPERSRTAIAFEDADRAAADRNLASWGVPVRSRPAGRPSSFFGSFPSLVLVLFVLSQVILFSAAVLPFFPGEEQLYSSTLNQAQGSISNTTLLQQFDDIYRNNVQIVSANVIPGLGAFALGAASYSTGRVIQLIGMQRSTPPALVILLLYAYPHSLIEEFSYPLATAAGVMLLSRWRRPSPMSGRRGDRGSVKFALALVAAAAQLLLAGFLEVIEPGLGAEALLLWIPIAAGLALPLAVRYWMKPRSGRPALPAAQPGVTGSPSAAAPH